MLALLEDEFVDKRKWMDKDEFLNMVAIAESTPGPIAINAATYIGYRIQGFFGALFATIGVIIPSFVIIMLISLILDQFLEIQIIANAFLGIRAGVIYLILMAGIRLFKGLKKNVFAIVIMLLVMGAMIASTIFALNLSVILLILLSGVAGLFVYSIMNCRNKEEKT